MNIPQNDIVTAAWAVGVFLFEKGRGKVTAARAYKRGREEMRAEIAAQGPTCSGCQHAYSYHKGMGLPCNFVEHRTEVRKTVEKDGEGKVIVNGWDEPVTRKETHHIGDFPCGCQAYDGPEPLPQVIAY